MDTKPVVFLVEDDRMLRELLQEFVEDLEVECFSFETADDALIDLLGRKPAIDLLIADQLTPGQLRGTELVIMVQQRWPGTPCIIMTGLQDSVLDLPGNTTLLQKPVAITELIAAAVAAIPDLNSGGGK